MQVFHLNWSLQRSTTHGYKGFELLSGPRDLGALLFSLFTLIIIDLFGHQYLFSTASLLSTLLQISFTKSRLTCDLPPVKVAVMACRGSNFRSHWPTWNLHQCWGRASIKKIRQDARLDARSSLSFLVGERCQLCIVYYDVVGIKRSNCC